MRNRSLILLSLVMLGLVGCNQSTTEVAGTPANADQQTEAQANDGKTPVDTKTSPST